MTAPLWTAAEAAAATGGTASADWAATGVSIDTRSLAPGELFVALADARDGHAFVADALAKGAAAALVSHRPEGVAEGAPLLIVEDTLKGLRGLASAARARASVRVAGITGSVGKTGTKEMLRAMLAPQGATHAAERSFNNHWGVPLTLARMPRESRFAAVEMGMNHAGEIMPLSRLSRPDVALITTVEAVHLENFADETGIADAKAEIFFGLPERGGVAVLNRDNRHFARLEAAARRRGARVIGFGEAPGAEARLVSVKPHPMATVAEADIHGERVLFRVSAPGRHLVLNALGALATAQALGADLAHAAIGLGQWQAPEGRGARWVVTLGEEVETIDVIDEAYNANPASVAAALAVLAEHAVEDGVGRVAGGRRIAVLGDMLELGSDETRLHADLADLPQLQALDVVFCVGERMRALDEALPPGLRGGWFADAPACAEKLRRAVDAGDVVMVKGSNGLRMGRIVDTLKGLGAARPADRAPEEG